MTRRVYILFMEKERQNLIKEIQKLIQEMDKESLLFIKDQSSVLIYNQKVRERNASTEKQNGEKKKGSKTKTVKKTEKNLMYILSS